MFEFIKKRFMKKKNANDKDILDEYPEGTLSRYGEESQRSLLSAFKKESTEYELRTFHDESDALITSLASTVGSFGYLVAFSSFSIPNALFLATAVFALYFSVISLFKTGNLKTYFMIATFPLTSMIVYAIIYFDLNVNNINNGLSLLALSVSLMIIPYQKSKERSKMKISKLKNEMILEQDEGIRKRDEIIKALEKSIEDLNKALVQTEEVSKEIDLLKDELKTITDKYDS